MSGPESLKSMAPLRRISPDIAQAMRRLHAVDRSLIETLSDGRTITLRLTRAPAGVSHGIDLTIDAAQPMTLSLVADQYRDVVGERDWWDYPEATRLLAWTLAHESLLGVLGRLFGSVPHPRGMQGVTLGGSDDRVPLGFVLEASDGRSASGRFDLSQPLLQRLIDHPGWRKAAPEAPAAGWETLPTSLSVQLPSLTLPQHELRALVAGDVLVAGPRSSVMQSIRLKTRDGSRGWIAQAESARLTLLRKDPTAPASDPLAEKRMTAPVTPPAASVPLTALDDLPMSLVIEIGEVTLTLGELAALRPGYVFELSSPADSLEVVLRVNGRAIGRGQMVAVGETLGVQVTAIEPGGVDHGNG